MNLSNAHTFNLTSQGSIYTHTVIQLIDGSSKLLVATLNRKVFCFDLSMTHMARPCGCVVVPQTQELHFTYLPGGAEIISIDAFNRSTTTDDFVIGVTIMKSAESGSSGQYINIYSEWEPGTQLKLDNDSLAHSCLSLELGFVPYQLGHCTVQGEVVWVLGGSDHRIHIFSEDKLRHTYTELEGGMVEFQEELPSVPLFTDILTTNGVRATAVACECGHLKLTLVDETKNELLRTWSLAFDGPLTSVILMRPGSPEAGLPRILEGRAKLPVRQPARTLSLVVGYSVGESMVFNDVVEHGLQECAKLPRSQQYDCVTAAWVADLNFDGNLTVMLGTAGQELLAYRFEESGWELKWRRSLPSPVLGIRYADLTGDGLKEVIVMTTSGIQILQHDLKQVKETALKRLNSLAKLVEAQ